MQLNLVQRFYYSYYLDSFCNCFLCTHLNNIFKNLTVFHIQTVGITNDKHVTSVILREKNPSHSPNTFVFKIFLGLFFSHFHFSAPTLFGFEKNMKRFKKEFTKNIIIVVFPSLTPSSC